MSFSAATLKAFKHSVGGGPTFWSYSNTDAHATVEGAAYFAGMGLGTGSLLTNKGMKVGDFVIVYKTGATVEVTLHVVTTVSAAGDCTVSAATLA